MERLGDFKTITFNGRKFDLPAFLFLGRNFNIIQKINQLKPDLNSCPAYANIESHEEAIILATGKKVTSKSSRHAGEGLFFTRRFLDANNGKLFILSGDARVEFKSGFNPLVNRVNYWQGTIVGMIFDLNTPVNAKQIFDSEYPEDADDMLEDIF